MRKSMVVGILGAAMWAVLGAVNPALAQCIPEWAAGFSVQPLTGPMAVYDTAVFDDGGGTCLYAAGSNGVVYKFDGVGWSSVGGRFFASTSGATGGLVYALHVFDPDGPGPEPASLYAAGAFRRVGSVLAGTTVLIVNVARWNGTQWVAVGSGWAGNFAYTLGTFDDGNGPRLYVGGLGTSSVAALQSFNLNSNAWETPTPDPLFITTTTIRTLKAFDDGSGPALFVGGDLTGAGGVSSPGIVKYTGSAWQAVASGLNGVPYSMDVFDDGSGPALFVGGGFSAPTPDLVVKWDGTAFSGTGSNISTSSMGPFVKTLTVGAETALYAGGSFSQAGGDTGVNGVGKYDGTQWSGVGYFHQPATSVYTRVNSFDFDGAGGADSLLAVLDVTQVPTKMVGLNSIGFPEPTPAAIGGTGRLQVLDLDGAGSEPARLFSVGRFLKYSDVLTYTVGIHHIGVFDGQEWSAFAGGLPALELAGDVSGEKLNACAVFNDGTGPDLYVAGVFSHNDGNPVNSILKWDGVNWLPLGDGIVNGAQPGSVQDLAVYDGGAGPALYVAGTFDTAGGLPVTNVAKWDGASWSAVGDLTSATSSALRVLDDGTGPALFLSGSITTGSGLSVSGVAKWDGTNWSAYAPGVSSVNDMLFHDAGTGRQLYVTGQFTTAGGTAANRVARWDGAAWFALGSGLGNASGVSGTIRGRCLAVHDDGTGPALYVGGLFSTAGGTSARAYSIAKWDGSAWSALDAGLRASGESTNAEVYSLASFTSGGRSALYAAGTFTMAGAANTPDVNFAKWSCPPPASTLGDLNCDGSVNFRDINPFVLFLSNVGIWQATYPGCPPANGDINGDGTYPSFGDINPFVALLSGQ